MKRLDDSKNHPSNWPRGVVVGFLCLVAVLVVAYSTFEIGVIVMAVIGRRAPSPDIIILLVLIPIAVLVHLP
jgi:hypothetical protein